MEYALTMYDVHKKIGDFEFDSLNLEIEKGTITAIVGKNGSGKSMLMKMIMNLIKTERGDIRILGQSVLEDDESWKTKVAYLPQRQPYNLPFTGCELKKLISQWYPTWDELLFGRIIDLFGIDLSVKYKNLSPGGQQQLNLALVIARNSQLLILDEPTAHIDIPTKAKLYELLIDWMENGERTIIITTHQAEEIQKLADYIIVIQEGCHFGQFEKDELSHMYKRYWFAQPLNFPTVPGECERKEFSLTTSAANQTEEYLQKLNVDWTNVQALNLEEILSNLVTK